MVWCEANRVDYVFGLARNARLTSEIATEMAAARAAAETNRQAGPPLQGLPLVHPGQLEPHPARHRQGRMDRGRGQSALYRHLAASRRDRRQAAV